MVKLKRNLFEIILKLKEKFFKGSLFFEAFRVNFCITILKFCVVQKRQNYLIKNTGIQLFYVEMLL